MRHLADQWDVSVDPHRAELQAAGGVHRPADVAGPDGGRQTVIDVIGPRDRLVVVLEPLHRDNRAKDLFLNDLGVLLDVGDQARLVEVAAARDRRAADQDSGAVLAGAVYESLDALELLLGDHRAHVDAFFERVADLHRLHALRQRSEQIVIDFRTGNDTSGRRAVLTGGEEAGDLDPLGDGLEMGRIYVDPR